MAKRVTTEKRAFQFSSPDAHRPGIAGIYADHGAYVATDGLRLAVIMGKRNLSVPDGVNIPREILPLVESGEAIAWCPRGESTDPALYAGAFGVGDLLIPAINGNFPDYYRVIPAPRGQSIRLDLATIKAAMAGAEVKPWTALELARLGKVPKLGPVIDKRSADSVNAFLFVFRLWGRWHWGVSLLVRDRAKPEDDTTADVVERRIMVLDSGESFEHPLADWAKTAGREVMQFNLLHVLDAVGAGPIDFYPDTRESRDEVLGRCPAIGFGESELHVVMAMRR